jgi:hypothetical protein
MRYIKTRDVHIPVASSPWWVNFALWLLIFVDPQYGSYFMAPFWCLEIWVVFQTFWKFVQPWFKQCWMTPTHLYFVICFERSVSYLDKSRTFFPENLSNCRVYKSVHEWIAWRNCDWKTPDIICLFSGAMNYYYYMAWARRLINQCRTAKYVEVIDYCICFKVLERSAWNLIILVEPLEDRRQTNHCV